MISVFDIIGPDMIGPSSSHTAGAVRIGLVTRKLLKEEISEVKIGLYGSFAKTGKGHGTHMALIGGLLGMNPNNPSVVDSFNIAHKRGLKFSFYTAKLEQPSHPNTAIVSVRSITGKSLKIQAASIGGGKIRLDRINGFYVSISDENTTILVINNDKKGVVAEVSSFLAERNINIATFDLKRDEKKKIALMSIKIDGDISPKEVKNIETIKGVISANVMSSFKSDI